jgi:hypothetical protein
MRSLPELQRHFADALLGVDGAPGATLLAGTTGAERLDIYRRTIASNYRNALGATYPVVCRLVGAAFFHAAVDACVAAHPSRSGDLNVYGGALGDFLAGYPPASELPYLSDVARLEWAIDEANRAAEPHADPELVLRALAGYQGDRLPSLRLRMDPSCRLIASPYPLLRIWQVNQPGHDGEMRVDFDAGVDRLRIRREPDGVALDRIAAGQFAWLSAVSTGANLAAAIGEAQDADAAFDLADALHRFIGDRTIAGILELA